MILVAFVLSLLADGSAHAGSYDVPPWLLQSNLIALQFTRDLADRTPEVGSMLGYTDFDALAIAVRDDLEKEDEVFFLKWSKIVQNFLKKEKHPELKRDFKLLDIVLKDQLESVRLDRKYKMIPFYKFTHLVLNNLRMLDNPMMTDRVKSAALRFHGYVKGVSGSKPLAEAYESRIRFLEKKYGKAQVTFPSLAEVEQYLRDSPAEFEEIHKILEKTKATGWQEDFDHFKAQAAKYNNFVKMEILPKAKKTDRLPLEVYRWLLRSKFIGSNELSLIKTGRQKYAETKKQMAVLSEKIGAELGLKDRSPYSIIQALKTKQLTQASDVEKKFHEADVLLSRVIEQRSLVTLPDSTLELRVSTPEESQLEPYPHLSYPPLAFSFGEKAFVILPVAVLGKNATDDFTYEAAVPELLAHEGRPGHEVYFQTLMNGGISVIRSRYGYSIPAVEGWAFYAEDLVYPQLPASAQLVVLQMRAWAYARMFLDPEVHLGKMKTEEAIRILMQEMGLSQPVAENEIRRYVSEDPGQGVGYGYGFLKILEAKEKAKKRLGRKFSERCFNDAVIALGLLPIDWLDEELKSLKCPEQAPAFGDVASRHNFGILRE